MRGLIVFLAASAALCAQGDPEDFRIEVTAFGWRTSVEGMLQAGVLPVDLHNDLNLAPRYTFFGRAVLKPARKHRFLVEGAPYSFNGRNTLSRSIEFNNRTYNIQDTVSSNADLTYFFGGYQYDLVSRPRGHFGLQVGGAYLDATGTITSTATGLSATRNERFGVPLAGAEFRAFLIPSIVSVSAEIKGMTLGDYGHFVQGGVYGGAGWRWFSVQAGYQILDADVHQANGSPDRSGIAPRIRGPVVGIQLRK